MDVCFFFHAFKSFLLDDVDKSDPILPLVKSNTITKRTARMCAQIVLQPVSSRKIKQIQTRIRLELTSFDLEILPKEPSLASSKD